MKRVQLSLFVPPPQARELERVRQLVDPVQARLIPAHVTLCRDAELDDLAKEAVVARLQQRARTPLLMRFGPAEQFDGHGLLLPCIDGAAQFHALRACILGQESIRHASPHLTLAHPRNPKSPDNALSHAAVFSAGLSISFCRMQYIEQIDGAPWIVTDDYLL
jgi:2'-5' RNA ligase